MLISSIQSISVAFLRENRKWVYQPYLTCCVNFRPLWHDLIDECGHASVRDEWNQISTDSKSTNWAPHSLAFFCTEPEAWLNMGSIFTPYKIAKIINKGMQDWIQRPTLFSSIVSLPWKLWQSQQRTETLDATFVWNKTHFKVTPTSLKQEMHMHQCFSRQNLAHCSFDLFWLHWMCLWSSLVR